MNGHERAHAELDYAVIVLRMVAERAPGWEDAAREAAARLCDQS